MNDELITVSATDLARLINKAEDADRQLDVAVEADQKWRDRCDVLQNERDSLRRAICRVLGISTEAHDITTVYLIEQLGQLPPPVPRSQIRLMPSEASWPDEGDNGPTEPEPSPQQPEELISVTDTGRRFHAAASPDLVRWYGQLGNGLTPPGPDSDVQFLREARHPERVWQRSTEELLDLRWRLVDRDVIVPWHELIDGLAGDHLVEVVEIIPEQEANTGE